MAAEGGGRRFVIGYALLEKKQRSFLQDSLMSLAEARGIDLIPVDPLRPLAQQGPFHAILHKLPGDASWNRQLAAYSAAHPDVVIVDPPDAIERLYNRASMLQAVTELQNAAADEATVGVPKQCVVLGGDVEEVERVAPLAGRLNFPVIGKPLMVDGSAKSHAMSLAFNAESLAKLKPPLVVQEFINHGGVMFKVYVVGEYVQCVQRRSLPDVHLSENEDAREALSFSQISNTAASSADADLQEIEPPPPNFISNVASSLKKALGLRLFNFDIIRDVKARSHYYIIDINYFPGYAKMPDYETVITSFFLSLANEQAAMAST